MNDSSRVVATGHTGAVSVDWVEALRMLGTLNAQTAICHESNSESSGTGGIHTVEPMMMMMKVTMILLMIKVIIVILMTRL